MSSVRSPLFNVIAGTAGGISLGLGVGRLYFDFGYVGIFWTVLGLVLVGWAVFGHRWGRRGTPSGETKGGTAE